MLYLSSCLYTRRRKVTSFISADGDVLYQCFSTDEKMGRGVYGQRNNHRLHKNVMLVFLMRDFYLKNMCMKAVDTSVRCSLSKECLRKTQYLRPDEMLTGLMSMSLFYRYFCNLLWNKKSLTSEKRTILSCQMLYWAGSAYSSIARANAAPRCTSLH